MKTSTWFCLVFFLLLSCFVQAQPIVNLGVDTTHCGNNFTIDAGNSGATFLWSTGAITQSISVTGSGIYWVDVTDLSGTTRDSIEVTLVNPPTFITTSPDTSVCLGIYQLNASSSADLIEWTDSVGNILGYGDSLLYDVQDTTTVYYQAKRYEPSGVTVGFPSTTTPAGFINTNRSIKFNVTEPILLNSISINVDNAAFTGLIYLTNIAGDTIGRQAVAPGQVGVNVIALNFSILPGLDYRLGMINISGGRAQHNTPTSNWSPFNYSFLELIEGVPFSAVYGYFYDWDVSVLGSCASDMDSVLLNSLITPTVDLGADTSLCSGSIILDATNVGSGFNYIWSTGATTTSIVTSVTDVYKVTVSSSGGNCPVEDSIHVIVRQQPIITQLARDTALCIGLHPIAAAANSGVIQWTNSTGTLLGLGDTLIYDVQDTSFLYYQAKQYEPSGITVGLPSTTVPDGFISANRSIKFNVTEAIVLNSVRINVDNAAFTGLIYLTNLAGDTIARQAVALGQVGVSTIVLNFSILPGLDYRLGMINISGGNAQYNLVSPVSAWNLYSYSFLELIEGVPFAAVYGYFYDWEVSVLGSCASDMDSVLLNSLITPVVNLGSDTILCSSSLALDATNVGSGFNYIWSTGAMTPTIVGNATDVYKVTVTSSGGNCPVEDSINIIARQRPILTQLAVDAALCVGLHPITAAANSGVIQWTDSMGTLLGLGDTLIYDVQDTVRIWYQSTFYEPSGTSVGLPSTTVPDGFINGNRAIKFNVTEAIVLNSVHINVDNAAFTGLIYLINQAGDTIARQAVAPGQVGVNTIALDFSILPGTDYQLGMINVSGGNAQYNLVSPASAWNLYAYSFLELIEGVPFSAVYGYFYDWEVSLLGTCASNVDSVLLNSLITPVVDLGTDTILCSSNLTLDATNVGSGFNYIWSTGATTSTIIGNVTDIYKVTVTSSGGNCPVEDSIDVIVRQRPIITQLARDTALCIGLHPIVAAANSGVIQWTDSTGALLGLGDILTYDIQDTARIWYQSAFYEPSNITVGLPSTTVPTGFVNSNRGIKFDVIEPILLNSVRINVDNAALTGLIYLTNIAGDTIATQVVAPGQVGVSTIVLNFSILPGTDYRLGMINISGGNAQYNLVSPVSAWNLYSYPFLELKEGLDFPLVYGYFYDWEVSVLGNCASDVDSVLLNSLETPVIDLPTDTLICNDTLMLDVFNVGATYNWGSTGITTSDIIITQEGTYRVTASIGTCLDSDSIDVYLTPIPTIALISADTTTCVGEIPRLAVGADFIKWYTEPIGGNYLGNGSPFMYNAQVSDTIWTTGQNFATKTYVQGLVDTFVAARSDYYYPVETRGLLFDVHEDILLKEVTMYIAQTSFIGTVELWDNNDVVLNSQPIVLTNLGKNIVPLGFVIPAGVDYKLMLTDYNVVSVLSELPYAGFPINGDFLTIKSGVQFPLVYQYFYNWNVQILSCPSERIASVVEVLPTPDIDFPTDTVICGDSLILDMSFLGLQSYLWSTGETTPDIILDSTTKISLSGTIGICSDEDSMNVFIVEPPSLIIPPNDTTVCKGNITFYASGNAAYYAWYDSSASATPFALGDSVVVNLQDTTTFWVEGIGFIPKSTPIGEQYNPNSNLNVWGTPQLSASPTRGMAFTVNSPILLNTVEIYVDTATTATLTIYKTGFPYYTQQLNLANVGANTVQIDTLLEAGNYSIELSNKSAGSILFLSPYSNLGQLNTPELTFTGSLPLSSQYVYFFNWKISTPSCATDRLPVHVIVPSSPPITLVADTATCTLSNITLDPVLNNDPAYTYEWSDASTGDTLSVTTSGYYGVTVTNDGACASEQDVYVQFLSTPNDPVVNDIGICAPQNVNIPVPINDGIVVWYDSSNLNTINYLGAPYNVYVSDTTDFWIDAAPRATTRIGKQSYANPNQLSAYRNSILASLFDVEEYAILDSVAIYVATVPANVGIVLMDSLGSIINTVNYTVTKAREKVFVPLNFLIPPGGNYQLSFNSTINSLFLVDQTPIEVPSSSANIATLTGTIFSDYNYFFDWHFSYAYPTCHSNPDTFTVTVSIPVDIPDSIYTCDSVTIDATHPNIVAYNWSNGLTTGIATFDNAGTYVLTITDGAACTVVDTVVITQPMPVGLPLGNAACDFQLATNYSLNNASFSWNTGDTTSVITIPSTGIYAVTVTTNEGCVLVDTAFISQIVSAPAPNLGNFVSACYTDTLDAGYAGQGMSYLWSTGAISQRIIVNTSGVYSVTVTHPLGCAGTDFVSVTIDTSPQASFTITQSGRTVLINNLSTGTNQATDYFWEMGDGTTYQIPNPFHTYIDSGCYIIRLTVTDACGSDTDTLRVAVDVPDSVCTIGVDLIQAKLEGLELSIVPNPNKGNFQLQLSDALKAKTELYLYDLNGRIVHEQILPLSAQTNWEIQTQNLPTGVYFLRLLNDKQSQTHRVLILRE